MGMISKKTSSRIRMPAMVEYRKLKQAFKDLKGGGKRAHARFLSQVKRTNIALTTAMRRIDNLV